MKPTVLQPHQVWGRQIALAAAFLLPASKLLEAPSILATYAAGDLLLPAILHFIVQFGVLSALVFAVSRSEKTLFERLNIRFGKWSILFYVLYAGYGKIHLRRLFRYFTHRFCLYNLFYFFRFFMHKRIKNFRASRGFVLIFIPYSFSRLDRNVLIYRRLFPPFAPLWK